MPLRGNNKGIFFGISAAFVFAVMAVLSQMLPPHISSSQISTVRGILTAVCLLPFITKDWPQLLDYKLAKFVWIRSFAGGVAVAIYFFNLKYTSAANAKALANTSPFFAALFGWFLFQEHLSKKEIIGMFLLAFGAWFLAIELNRHSEDLQWIVGSVGSLFTAVAYLSLKKASAKYSPSLIVFTFGVAVALVSSLSPGSWGIPSSSELFILLLTGFCGLIGQVFLTYSYINLKNATASALTLMQSVFLIVYDLFWSGRLVVGAAFWGNILIFVGMTVMILAKEKPAISDSK